MYLSKFVLLLNKDFTIVRLISYVLEGIMCDPLLERS